MIDIGLIILFVTGSPVDDKTKGYYKEPMNGLQVLTIANVAGTEWKIVVALVFAYVLITALSIFFIVKYMSKFNTDKDFIANKYDKKMAQKIKDNHAYVKENSEEEFSLKQLSDIQISKRVI
jgi:uncharacterized ion transporter superfamily protein YfcC